MPRRVLIADDNETIRRTLQSQIEKIPGVQVCGTAANGVEAVEFAIALRPDVIIVDVLMPNLNGIEVAGVLRKELPETKVILFTLYSDVVSPQIVNALGARLVSKTEGLPSLRRILRELFDLRTRHEANEHLSILARDPATTPAQLEFISQQLRAPITRCGRDLRYVWVNQHYSDFLKCPVEKIVGRSILDVVGKSAFDALQDYFEQTLRGQDVSYELDVEFESAGLRHIAASYKPTFGSDGSPDGWLAYVEDMTAEMDLPRAG